MTDSYLTLAEFAAVLRISDKTARRVVAERRVDAFQIRGPNSEWRIPARAFRQYVSKNAGGVVDKQVV